MSPDRINVGIAEIAISDADVTQLTAPNLGSCLGIACYDHKRRRGGMIHCLLPMSINDPEKAKANPCMYVDTGVALLLNEMLKFGTPVGELKIYVAGGAQINDVQGVFNIGKKNYTVLRKILWKNNLLISGEQVGGVICRTISLEVKTGDVWVRTGSEQQQLNGRGL